MSEGPAGVVAKYRTWLVAVMVVYLAGYFIVKFDVLPGLLQTQSNLTPVPLQYHDKNRVISNTVFKPSPRLNHSSASITPPPHIQHTSTTSTPPLHQRLHLNPVYEPSLEHELARRQVERDVQENTWFINDQLNQLLKKKEETSNIVNINVDTVKNILEEIHDRKRVTQYDLRRLKDMDGLPTWREREAAELSELIQRRLYAIQHPPDCTTAKIVACRMERGCGIGCDLHHVLFCMMAAYGSQRTMVLKRGTWEQYFLPISSCNTSHITRHSKWPATGLEGDSRVVYFPDWDHPVPPPDYLPLSIPQDIWQRLLRFHGEPGAWWVGQFFQYLLRPNQYLQDNIHNLTTTLNFQTPIVGVHIRLTDKKKEAKLHDLEEYMNHVEEYYRTLDLKEKNATRRIYLATDDRNIFSNATIKYPNYQILYNPETDSLGEFKLRKFSKFSCVVDVFMLSRCSFVVGTLSSNVGRLVYEIMQTLYPDASSYFSSLDNDYFVYFQRPKLARARFPHYPRRSGVIMMQTGDLIKEGYRYPYNFHDGFAQGVNLRTMKRGKYPYYKVEKVYDIVNTSSYGHFDKTGKL
ncbi:alpha-(1,6)-fucosyltransferase-like isoform X1 [Homarus americanus]|uniref:alpha-(1,6)-fucosyltransferase-like isoform X1 n=1 Tax=Homarus americanus TaxID=6706 RepID=UPI001C458C9F|nr:alpha-(1,6)-fucosyltransferase-like isoform X1 [Homarus americanus]